MQIYWTAALAFGIVIALFAVQNSAPITLRFLWFSAENVAVSVLVMISATLGALLTLMFGLGREVKLQWSRRSARRAASSLEKRVSELQGTVEQLQTEKAVLQAQVDAYAATGGELPRYEAVPVSPPEVAPGDEPPALHGGPARR